MSDISSFLFRPHNPRELSDEDRHRLDESMHRYADIGMIMRNVRTNEIFGGAQRLTILLDRPDECDLVITDRFDEPDQYRTTAYGYIGYRGMRWMYREVDWPEEWVEEACIKANLLGGQWDFSKLEQHWNVTKLIEWGFQPWQFRVNAPTIDLEALAPTMTGEKKDREGTPTDNDRTLIRKPGYVRLEFHVRTSVRDAVLGALNHLKDTRGLSIEDGLNELATSYMEGQ